MALVRSGPEGSHSARATLRNVSLGVPQIAHDVRRWRTDDAPAAVKLLMRAYPTSDQSRPFAPRGTIGEWTDYLHQLMEADGCGQLLPDACVSVSFGPNRLAGLALVSRISKMMPAKAQHRDPDVVAAELS